MHRDVTSDISIQGLENLNVFGCLVDVLFVIEVSVFFELCFRFGKDENYYEISQDIYKEWDDRNEIDINIENLNDHFKKYLNVISFWLKKDLHSVISILQNIITDHKKDILAIRLLHFNNIFIGIDSNFLRKHLEILDSWTKTDPFYNLILGMTSFAYEENDQLSLAQNLANESLAMSKKDLWSWHALLHVQDNELSSDLESNEFFTSIDWSNMEQLSDIYGGIKPLCIFIKKILLNASRCLIILYSAKMNFI